MNRTFISFLLIVTSMFCGCKKHQVLSVKIIEDKEPKALLISKKQKIEVECLLPIMILAIGDKLLIYNEVEKDVFSVFGLDDYALLYQFGSSGKGPEEYQFIDRNTIREYKGDLTLLDRYRFKKINLGTNTGVY